jgi:AcrR family transcriptional regulator
MPIARKRPQQYREATYEKLLQAAAKEFNERGFGGTDSNRIARRAGFAPQTFYRWFDHKVEIFIKTYERWVREEFADVAKLMAENASDARVVQTLVAHHRAYLIFRRSLRELSVENAVVRAARARSRKDQIARLRSLNPNIALDDGSMAATLLQTERLADALAEGEFRDMGLNKKAGEVALARLIHELRTRSRLLTPRPRPPESSPLATCQNRHDTR